MSDVKKEAAERKRTIEWEVRIDVLADKLALDAGFNRRNGGVSAYLAALVLREAGKEPLSAFKGPLAQIDKRLAALEKKDRK